jgi:hemin uptake protein HemP
MIDSVTEHRPPASHPAEGNGTAGTTSRRKILLKDLMQDGRELIIIHGPDEYLLRVTKNGKLILTK